MFCFSFLITKMHKAPFLIVSDQIFYFFEGAHKYSNMIGRREKRLKIDRCSDWMKGPHAVLSDAVTVA